MAILAGEIGKKTTKLALFTHKKDDANKQIQLDSLLVSKAFTTKDYVAGMPNMIEAFLQECYNGEEDIYGACFGIAAPVEKGKTTINGQDFEASFSEHDFRQKLPYKNLPLSFINDMEAIGYGIFLGDGENQLDELYPGNPKVVIDSKDNRALMLVVEGLGQALWYCGDQQEGKLKPIPSEGGHANFAPRTIKEIELLHHLKENDPHKTISYEYVLSTPGLFRIHEFFQTQTGEQAQNINDANSLIKEALQGNKLCKETLEMFISIWGARAGDLALEYKAKGGVYIGGIPIPIETLKEGIFVNAFIDKDGGKFKEFNEEIPIKVFQEEDIVLWGAARYAIDAGFVTKGKFAIMRSNQ